MARTHQRRTRRPAVHPPRTPAPSPHPRRCPSPPRQVPAHRRRNPALPDRQEDHPPRVPAHPRHAAASCTSRHQRHRAVARPRGHLLIKQIPARGHGSQRTHPRTHHARRGDRSVSADRRHAGLPRQPHRAIANYPEPTAKAAHRTTTSRSPIGMTRISAQAGLWRSRHNTAERMIRRPVVTRKNAYGSRNDAAARLAARVWTVTATAEMAGLNVPAYLTAYLDACGRRGGKPPAGPDLDRFLPWNASPDDLRTWAQPAARLNPYPAP